MSNIVVNDAAVHLRDVTQRTVAVHPQQIRNETTAPVSPHSEDSSNFAGTQAIKIETNTLSNGLSQQRNIELMTNSLSNVTDERLETLEDCEVRDDDEEHAIFHPNANSDIKIGNSSRLTGETSLLKQELLFVNEQLSSPQQFALATNLVRGQCNHHISHELVDSTITNKRHR